MPILILACEMHVGLTYFEETIKTRGRRYLVVIGRNHAYISLRGSLQWGTSSFESLVDDDEWVGWHSDRDDKLALSKDPWLESMLSLVGKDSKIGYEIGFRMLFLSILSVSCSCLRSHLGDFDGIGSFEEL